MWTPITSLTNRKALEDVTMKNVVQVLVAAHLHDHLRRRPNVWPVWCDHVLRWRSCNNNWDPLVLLLVLLVVCAAVFFICLRKFDLTLMMTINRDAICQLLRHLRVPSGNAP